LPPLRERRDDIETLAGRLLARVYAEYRLPDKRLAETRESRFGRMNGRGKRA
jgi:DNA-binding NtrC family response regulator